MRDSTNNTSNTNERSKEEEINSNESDSEELISANERSEEELISASEEELIEEEQPVISASNNKSKIKPQLELQSNASTIYKKVKKNTQSKGVDNIEQLPLDWFTKVRQTQKQHNIIPRKNDDKK